VGTSSEPYKWSNLLLGRPANITGTKGLSTYIAACLSFPFLLLRPPTYMSQQPKTSRGPYNPMFDHQNPNPIINCAASTRQASRMEAVASTSGASSSSSFPHHRPPSHPRAPKTTGPVPMKTPATACSSVLAPLAAQMGLQTPTAASVTKGAAAPASKHARFGGAKLHMPSHMAEVGKRGPLPRRNSVLGTEENPP
jgi:hypothetical protein